MRVPSLIRGQPTSTLWFRTNSTIAVIITPINDVMAHRDIGAGKSPKVVACT